MNTNRFLVLVFGPLALIAGCYWITFGLPGTSSAAATTADVRQDPIAPPLPSAENPQSTHLTSACRLKAAAWTLRLGETYHAIYRSPLVIVGRSSAADLHQLHRNMIEPIYQAIQNSYLKSLPHQPITILLLDNADEYRRIAQEIDGYNVFRYHGYYKREDNRIVLDISSGNGTLAHEMTHALVNFDFPQAPEWFDEGLASLHEQCEFSADGKTLVGLHNWRLGTLGSAARTRQLQPLGKLIRHEAFRGEGEGLHYAEVRYLCLYLQQRGLLKSFYREFRDSVATDPQGIQTLCHILKVDSVTQIDENFRSWLRKEFHSASRARK